MPNYDRRSFIPFSLHTKPYDPPGPSLAPIPSSAPIVVIPPVPASPPPGTQPGNPLDTAAPNTNADSASGLTSARLRVPDSESGNETGSRRDARRSIAQVRAEMDDTVAIMRDNIQSIAERGERLESLEHRTENLIVSARAFRKVSHKVRKEMWWKEFKMRLLIGLAVSVVITLTALSIVQAVRHSRAKAQIQANKAKTQPPPAPPAPQVTPDAAHVARDTV